MPRSRQQHIYAVQGKEPRHEGVLQQGHAAGDRDANPIFTLQQHQCSPQDQEACGRHLGHPGDGTMGTSHHLQGPLSPPHHGRGTKGCQPHPSQQCLPVAQRLEKTLPSSPPSPGHPPAQLKDTGDSLEGEESPRGCLGRVREINPVSGVVIQLCPVMFSQVGETPLRAA